MKKNTTCTLNIELISENNFKFVCNNVRKKIMILLYINELIGINCFNFHFFNQPETENSFKKMKKSMI